MKSLTPFAFCVLVLIGCSDAPAAPAEVKSEKEFDTTAATASIMATIENETKSFYERNYNAWKGNFVQSRYAFQSWNNSDGSIDAKTGWPEVDAKIGTYIKEHPVASGGTSHPTVLRKNMLVKFFSPSAAYLLWDQYQSDSAQKMFTFSKEIRLMEKENEQWKILNVSAFWEYKNRLEFSKVTATN